MASETGATGARIVPLNSALRDKIKTMPLNALVDMQLMVPVPMLVRARAAFYYGMAHLEQMQQQRKPPAISDLRRMEYQLVLDIADTLGVVVPDPTSPTELKCRGGSLVSECSAAVDLPDEPFLGTQKPGWHCYKCSIPPGTHGPLGDPCT